MKNTKKLNINREWYRNSNVRPKSFLVSLERSPNGSYRVVNAFVENVVNQHEFKLQKVDVRDLTSDIKQSTIFSY
jgi:hypothetical protein